MHEVKCVTFTPLVMSITGGMGRAATTFCRRLASMISEKRITSLQLNCELGLLQARFCPIEGIDHVNQGSMIIKTSCSTGDLPRTD